MRDNVFTDIDLFCPRSWSVLFTVIVLQGDPFIEPGRDLTKCFVRESFFQLRMRKLMGKIVNVQVFS